MNILGVGLFLDDRKLAEGAILEPPECHVSPCSTQCPGPGFLMEPCMCPKWQGGDLDSDFMTPLVQCSS